ncbi:adenylate/guanylate cyclase domain-containing protein [Kiloniella sp. b19]|uniref:adenylate/guanylate cyclase domain-containing protein n=1 Tax=Kiloniella sp. GXU_MW_B19 TaxID=3141326 RepID=UPI0031E12124
MPVNEAPTALRTENDSLISSIIDWMMDQSLSSSATMEDIFSGCCKRLRASGIPIGRAYIAFRTLHPLYRVMGVTWELDKGVRTVGYTHENSAREEQTAAWQNSPFNLMFNEGIPQIRRRLCDDTAIMDFGILPELKEQGYTDYMAYAFSFEDSREDDHFDTKGMIGSWASDSKGGFSDAHLQSLVRLQKRLAVISKIIIQENISKNICTTYLGRNAGNRVLKGQIKRGDGERIHSVIWYSDLRNSTALADSLPEEEYLQVLNGYFECTAGAIMDHGGDVLLLIGDAVLGIFPLNEGEDHQATCFRALMAAEDTTRRMTQINSEGTCADGRCNIDFGLGLHVGNVMFGNVGLPDRLQFTTIGPAVNEASRLESLTKTLDRRVLCSQSFRDTINCDSLQHMGDHKVAGVQKALPVYGIDPNMSSQFGRCFQLDLPAQKTEEKLTV